MGIGIFQAGRGKAGTDPVQDPSAPSAATAYPRALKLDLQQRAYVINADGTLADVHPIDASVVHLLGIEQGAIASAKSFGHRLRTRLNRISPLLIPTTAEDEVRAVLSPLISGRDILLVAVAVDASTAGKILIAVTYTNLRDPNFNPQNPAASIRTLRL